VVITPAATAHTAERGQRPCGQRPHRRARSAAVRSAATPPSAVSGRAVSGRAVSAVPPFPRSRMSAPRWRRSAPCPHTAVEFLFISWDTPCW